MSEELTVLWRDRALKAVARIEAALALHRDDDGICSAGCEGQGDNAYRDWWPCETVRALMGEEDAK